MRSLEAGSLACTGLLLAIGCGLMACGETEVPPSQLFGRWVTTAPAYQGRYFEIRPMTLTIETKTGPTFVYAVQRFSVERGDDDSLKYIVHYSGLAPDYTPQALRLVSDGHPDRLKIENRQEVWTRVANEDGGVPAGGR